MNEYFINIDSTDVNIMHRRQRTCNCFFLSSRISHPRSSSGVDLFQSAMVGGAGIDACQALCTASADCTAFEWYAQGALHFQADGRPPAAAHAPPPALAQGAQHAPRRMGRPQVLRDQRHEKQERDRHYRLEGRTLEGRHVLCETQRGALHPVQPHVGRWCVSPGPFPRSIPGARSVSQPAAAATLSLVPSTSALTGALRPAAANLNIPVAIKAFKFSVEVKFNSFAKNYPRVLVTSGGAFQMHGLGPAYHANMGKVTFCASLAISKTAVVLLPRPRGAADTNVLPHALATVCSSLVPATAPLESHLRLSRVVAQTLTR